MLSGKRPVIKVEADYYTIINSPAITMRHPMIDIDINQYARTILSSPREVDPRFKPLFAIVTGMGRGKTRLLVELQRELNKQPTVYCVAVTFNGYWEQVLRPACIPRTFEPVKFHYAFNIVARILSMTYHASLSECEMWLINTLQRIDLQGASAADIIHECIKFIINQYRARGEEVDQFVLLVDECVAIEKSLDPVSYTHLTLPTIYSV